MSDYELAYLFLESVNTIGDMLVNYFNMVFAFLVASVLAAHRMSRRLAVIALGLFTTFQFGSIFQIKRAAETFGGLGLRIKETAGIEASDLDWHGALNSPAYVLESLPNFFTVTLILCYGAAIYFFLLCRRGGFSLGQS